MARTTPMNMIVPPVMPVGANSGSHPRRVESQSSSGRTTGRKMMSPQRP